LYPWREQDFLKGETWPLTLYPPPLLREGEIIGKRDEVPLKLSLRFVYSTILVDTIP